MTCSSGRIVIALYDGKTGELLGKAAKVFSGGRISLPMRLHNLPEKIRVEYQMQ